MLFIAQANLGLLSDEDTALLVVAALLCLWLWMLVRRRDEAPEFRRPTPLSLNELGRMVFQAARSRDRRTWRALFLNGAEAANRMGDGAEAWLESHSMPALSRSLEAIGSSIPAKTIYVGCEEGPDGRCALKLKEPEGSEFLIAVGHAEKVGAAWRLVQVG